MRLPLLSKLLQLWACVLLTLYTSSLQLSLYSSKAYIRSTYLVFHMFSSIMISLFGVELSVAVEDDV